MRIKRSVFSSLLGSERERGLTALSGPPPSPPSLLEREEVKCAPSNKHTRMPMQNTLPSLLATAIFLKLVSSRAAQASLSLELLPGGEVGPRHNTSGPGGSDASLPHHLPMNMFNTSVFPVCFEENVPLILYMPGKLAGIQSEGKRKRERALQTLGDQAFLIQIPIFYFHVYTSTHCCVTLKPCLLSPGMACRFFFLFFKFNYNFYIVVTVESSSPHGHRASTTDASSPYAGSCLKHKIDAFALSSKVVV